MRRMLIAVTLWLWAGGATAAGRELPWKAIAQADRLTPKQHEVVATLCDSIACYYGCTGTIAACLEQNPPNPAAQRIAALIVRRVLAGVSSDEVADAVRRRALSAHPAHVYAIDVTGLPPLGDTRAPVKVVVYTDYECPYCDVASAALERIVEEMPGKVVVYTKNFPVKTHPLAVSAATAAIAAERQGKFWPMHDLLYQHRGDMSEEQIVALARELGLDPARFAADRADSTTMARIRAEKLEGFEYGIKATPGIFINGKPYLSAKTYEDLQDRIAEELEVLELEGARP